MKYLNNVDSTSWSGKILNSKSFGKFEVIKYVNWSNVTVRFIDTGYVKTCDMKEVKTGSIKDYMKPSVYGVGIMGDNYLTIGSNAKIESARRLEPSEYTLNSTLGFISLKGALKPIS